MKTFRRNFNSILSGLLAVVVTTVFSFAASAAPDDSKDEPIFRFQDPGIMTVMGEVTVDGNLARMGETFYSGSTVTTGDEGVVIIELGKLGRASVGPRTTATVKYSADQLLITTTCDDMRVSVREGQCTVRRRGDDLANSSAGDGAPSVANSVETENTLKPGESKILTAVYDEHFDSNVEVTAGPVIDIVVNCGRDVVCPAPFFFDPPSRFWPFAFWLFGGSGTVTSVTTVVVKNNPPLPRLSDPRPPGE
jgi:hypothetical protein